MKNDQSEEEEEREKTVKLLVAIKNYLIEFSTYFFIASSSNQ